MMPRWCNTPPHTPVVHCCCTICAIFNIGTSKCINLAWSFDYLLGLGCQVSDFADRFDWFRSLFFKQTKFQIIGEGREWYVFFVVMSCWCIKHCMLKLMFNCDPSHYDRQQVNIKASWSLTERPFVWVLLCFCTLLVLIQHWVADSSVNLGFFVSSLQLDTIHG